MKVLKCQKWMYLHFCGMLTQYSTPFSPVVKVNLLLWARRSVKYGSEYECSEYGRRLGPRVKAFKNEDSDFLIFLRFSLVSKLWDRGQMFLCNNFRGKILTSKYQTQLQSITADYEMTSHLLLFWCDSILFSLYAAQWSEPQPDLIELLRRSQFFF